MSRLGHETLVYCREQKKMVPKGTEAQRELSNGATHYFRVKNYAHISRALPAKGWGYDHEVNWDKWAPDPHSPSFTRPYFESKADVESFSARNPSYSWDVDGD